MNKPRIKYAIYPVNGGKPKALFSSFKRARARLIDYLQPEKWVIVEVEVDKDGHINVLREHKDVACERNEWKTHQSKER